MAGKITDRQEEAMWWGFILGVRLGVTVVERLRLLTCSGTGEEGVVYYFMVWQWCRIGGCRPWYLWTASEAVGLEKYRYAMLVIARYCV